MASGRTTCAGAGTGLAGPLPGTLPACAEAEAEAGTGAGAGAGAGTGSGADTAVPEERGDFPRGFRGDTVHDPTHRPTDRPGPGGTFRKPTRRHAEHPRAATGDGPHTPADHDRPPGRAPYTVLLPWWDFPGLPRGGADRLPALRPVHDRMPYGALPAARPTPHPATRPAVCPAGVHHAGPGTAPGTTAHRPPRTTPASTGPGRPTHAGATTDRGAGRTAEPDGNHPEPP